MIVYRNRRREQPAGPMLDRLRRGAERLASTEPHERLVGLLIQAGMLESGVADARHLEEDEEDEMGRGFRDVVVAAGHLVRLSWRGRQEAADYWRDRLCSRLHRIDARQLPPTVAVEIPEGYAHYGLFPECYLEAAEQCAEELGSGPYVCLGLRAIGTSLSGLVTAALEARGAVVQSFTIRPRGHPFDRTVLFGPRLCAAMTAAAGARVLLVDEGPGLSGSSLAGAAEALAQLGFPDDRIVFLPSWDTDGAGLCSARARSRWQRHRRYVVSFDEVWLRSGRLAAAVGADTLEDVSAGAWRDRLLSTDAPRPPVQPQHERRKFLTGRRLIAFAGHAGLAERRLERAAALAEAGFGPQPLGTGHGFLIRTLADGAPVATGEPDQALLDTMARYLAHLRTHFPAEDDDAGGLCEMIDTNVAEVLGESGTSLLARHRRRWGAPAPESAVALDGRMLRHEWLRSRGGYLKVDALDHHDDHFFPGPRDVAWDLAAACLEFRLGPSARAALVARYCRASGDHTIRSRLPAYAVAYLASRVGYTALAATTLGASADGCAFRDLSREYTGSLRRELEAGAARWTA